MSVDLVTLIADGERVVALSEATAREVHDAIRRAVATRAPAVDDALEHPLDTSPLPAVADDD